jgi:hypothetical protein
MDQETGNFCHHCTAARTLAGFRPKNRWQKPGDEDYRSLWTGETVGYLGNDGSWRLANLS